MKRKEKAVIFLIIFLSIACGVRAQESLDWGKCVEEAKRRHPNLAAAAEKIAGSKASKEITRSATLPQITGNASEITSKNLSSGNSTASSQSSSSSSSGGSSTDYTYGATGQQLLFDGFKTSFDLSGAERNIIASRYNYDVTSSDIRLKLRTAFANLLRAQELLKVTEEILARRKQNFGLVKLRYEGGQEHKGSLLLSEADVADAEYKVGQAKRNIYSSQIALIKELGRSNYTSADMIASGDFEISNPETERPDFERLAESNPLLRQLVALKEAAKYGVKSAGAQFFPQVFATGSLDNSNTDEFPAQNDWSIGTTLTLPIFDGANRFATLSKAKATLGQTEADEKSGRDGVILTMANTWANFQDAVKNVSVQKKFLYAARERSKIAEAEYSIGFLAYDNWIIIEDNFVNAKTAYLNAETGALVAEANWIQAKGGTLDYD